MANQLKQKQQQAMRDNLEAYARAQHELQQAEVKSDISSDKVSMGTSYHKAPAYTYAPPPQYGYGYYQPQMPFEQAAPVKPYQTLAAASTK